MSGVNIVTLKFIAASSPHHVNDGWGAAVAEVIIMFSVSWTTAERVCAKSQHSVEHGSSP